MAAATSHAAATLAASTSNAATSNAATSNAATSNAATSNAAAATSNAATSNAAAATSNAATSNAATTSAAAATSNAATSNAAAATSNAATSNAAAATSNAATSNAATSNAATTLAAATSDAATSAAATTTSATSDATTATSDATTATSDTATATSDATTATSDGASAAVTTGPVNPTSTSTSEAPTTATSTTSTSSSPSRPSNPSTCITPFLKSNTRKAQVGYSEGLTNGWLDRSSTPPPNFFSTANVHTGAYAIEWNPSNNKLKLAIPPFTTKQFNTIGFWMNPAKSGQSITVSITGNDGEYPCEYDLTTFYGGSYTAGWKWVGLPLASFGITQANKITGITFSDASGGASNGSVYFDDISLQTILPSKASGAMIVLTQNPAPQKRGDDYTYTPDTEATIAAALAKLTGQPALRFVVKQNAKKTQAEVTIQQSQGNPVPAAVVAAQVSANHHMITTKTPVKSAEIATVEEQPGMTGGAVAGLVIGIILFIALIIAIVIIAVLLVLRVKEHKERRNSTEGLLPSADSLNQSLLSTMYMPPNVPLEMSPKTAKKNSKEGRWV